MSFKYGVSFNCLVDATDGTTEIGGGAEGCISTDYVGNDLSKIGVAITTHEYVFKTADHPFIGREVEDIGGEIVAVMVYADDLNHVCAVVFEDPQVPTVVE